MPPSVDLHLRSYRQSVRPGDPDRHDFAQLVLPLSGALLLEVEGRAQRLDPLHAGFIAPGAWHAQCGQTPNRSIILDVDTATLAPAASERLFAHPFAPLALAARKLVEYMGLMADGGTAPRSVVQGWAPLLLDTLTLDAPRPASRALLRLTALQAGIEAAPGQPWTTDTMARYAGMSVSRLHALFREELDTSPHAWLLAQRIARACEWLASTALPIAEIALRAGFSEQSALTRALRKATGMTPAAYRRQQQR
jgi:AraC-like DNA-binding protein